MSLYIFERMLCIKSADPLFDYFDLFSFLGDTFLTVDD